MFCTKCGKENFDTNQFCNECGEPLKKSVQNNICQKEQEEIYLGGFSSTHLRKDKFSSPGYGIYATNKRIFGLKNRNLQLKMLGLALVGGGALLSLIDKTTQQLKDETKKNIEELERNKDFEVNKEEIAEIEWKKVNFWTGGHLMIKLNSGKQFKIEGNNTQESEFILTLMQKFYPERLQIK
jgi:hypothetical protein